MSALKKLPFDPSIISDAFQLIRGECQELEKWLGQSFQMTESEQIMFDETHASVAKRGEYWNEEELKMRLVSPLFMLAKVEDEDRIQVFYERPLVAEANGYQLSVICDCLVAASTSFTKPTAPYFFLQEYKKLKGEKRDAEAQMLIAMLAAQQLNGDQKPIYGGYMIGPVWRLATLVGNRYCTSRLFLAAEKEDLRLLVFALRALKGLILNR